MLGRRLALMVVIVGLMLTLTLVALTAQNEGCFPWQERVGIGDGPFGPQEDITACR